MHVENRKSACTRLHVPTHGTVCRTRSSRPNPNGPSTRHARVACRMLRRVQAAARQKKVQTERLSRRARRSTAPTSGCARALVHRETWRIRPQKLWLSHTPSPKIHDGRRWHGDRAAAAAAAIGHGARRDEMQLALCWYDSIMRSRNRGPLLHSHRDRIRNEPTRGRRERDSNVVNRRVRTRAPERDPNICPVTAYAFSANPIVAVW